ncbi:MAG: hypothetical protein PHU12_00245 [Candidatus Aenigmarchaeota archaeon]|nr:hypothetical protein [Candidatus Aenigmarchaeota archaeon]
METRVYKIEAKDFGKVKNVLESEDKFDVLAKCPKCGKKLEGMFSPFDISKYDSKEDNRKKLQPPEKKCECGQAFKFEKKVLLPNMYARNGYTLKTGDSIGKPGANYLLVKAEKEFFDKHEKEITKEGAVLIKGKDAEDVKKKVKEEEEGAASGMGMIFG